MSMKIEIITHNNYIEVISTGEYKLQDAIDQFPLIIEECRKTGISKVLIDARQLKGNPRAVEKIIYAAQSVKQYQDNISLRDQSIQLAYVLTPPVVSTYEPGLEYAQLTGIPAKIFLTIEDACEWLGIKPEETD